MLDSNAWVNFKLSASGFGDLFYSYINCSGNSYFCSQLVINTLPALAIAECRVEHNRFSHSDSILLPLCLGSPIIMKYVIFKLMLDVMLVNNNILR